jgi:holo-[acyl-carrier protein] synthase
MLPPHAAPRLAVGVDTVEIARIRAVLARHRERFLRRVYTPHERERYAARPLALAGRYAAKEAAAKALGTGIGPVGWHSIEIRNDDAGKPILVLHAAAAALARSRHFTEWHVSITHSRDLATAFVVGYRTESELR